MARPNYTIIDFEKYLNQKRSEFNSYRKSGIQYVNKKLIELGRTLGEYPEVWKVKSNRVKGCTSNVFINIYLTNGKIFYSGHSDSEVVRGQLALLINGLNMLTPEEIVNHTEQYLNDFVKNTDVRFSMTISRANSLGTLYQFMKIKAEEFLN
ncbi:MAG: SufE family protein [Planctomycetia bacterium]|nr:SufE family protein [Planctomycetia bacterium]